jgi:hypothetical protein
MARSLKWGGILGLISVALALIDSIIWISLNAASETQVFEYAYIINMVFYLFAGFVAAYVTGYIRLGIADALIAAFISGTIGTVSQVPVFHPLDAWTFFAVLVMVLIEAFSAVPCGALGGAMGRLVRGRGPLRSARVKNAVGETAWQ